MAKDFDAKLNRRHRNDWSGQFLEIEVFEEDQRVMRISVSRRDGYVEGAPSEYSVRVVDVTDANRTEVTLLNLNSGETKVAS